MVETPTRPRTGALLFLPVRWQRVVVLKWLKRVHAWTGFWGALLFLMMGTSGFLLNHRTLLKIDASQPVEVTRGDFAVVPGTIGDADGLARWAQAKFALPVEGKAPPPAPMSKTAVLGVPTNEVPRWTRVFTLANEKLTVDYLRGAPAVQVKREANGMFATLKNLHKGVGLPVAWVLLIDTVAGALIAMALTGFLLWSRLHGPRLLAGALAGGSLLWAIAAALPAMG